MLAEDVVWANGMHGGHVHGREAVRAYWTRQWEVVSPHVKPIAYDREADGTIIALVTQSVRDLDGNPVQGQSHGLRDTQVDHVFQLHDGKITRFDIREIVTRLPIIQHRPGKLCEAQIIAVRNWADAPEGAISLLPRSRPSLSYDEAGGEPLASEMMKVALT